MRGMSGAAPVLLLSMPQMTDPNFTRTVILLCDYTEEGAFGLVVNRQMSEPAWTMIKTEPPVRVDPDLRLWMGGPVDPQQTWVLMSDSHGPDEEQREICPGALLSPHPAACCGALSLAGPLGIFARAGDVKSPRLVGRDIRTLLCAPQPGRAAAACGRTNIASDATEAKVHRPQRTSRSVARHHPQPF